MIRNATWPDGTVCGAVFSSDERHRYLLTRVFPNALPFTGPRPAFPLFLMLNPSTATHEVDDPTVRRCAGFAKRWGYESFHACNLFSLRATDPQMMMRAHDASGDPFNIATILRSAKEAEIIVCAWGAWGAWQRRDANVLRLLRDAGLGEKLRCLGKTQDGSPRHPLRLASSTELQGFNGADFLAQGDPA